MHDPRAAPTPAQIQRHLRATNAIDVIGPLAAVATGIAALHLDSCRRSGVPPQGDTP